MTVTKSKAIKADAIRELREMGAELLKAENRFGETKTGWWLDGVWIGPASDPVSALNSAKYGA